MASFTTLTVAFVVTSSITTFDKRSTQAKREGILPPDEPSLPSWVAFIFWIHIGLIIAMLILNWEYAIIVFIVMFVLAILPVLETIGNTLMSPFKQR
ncbi:hypothetical protein ES708_18493 [subsurface metagenome]